MRPITTLEWVARNALRILRHGRMLRVMGEFFVVRQFHIKLRSVIVRRKNRALAANQQASAAGNLTLKRLDVAGDFARRFVAAIVFGRIIRQRLTAVIPPKCDRTLFDGGMMVEKGWVFGG